MYTRESEKKVNALLSFCALFFVGGFTILAGFIFI